MYSYNVHAHIKQVHGGQKRSTPSIPCDICNKKFRNEHSLKQHLTKEHEYVEESDMIFEEELEGVEVGSENEEITGEWEKNTFWVCPELENSVNIELKNKSGIY